MGDDAAELLWEDGNTLRIGDVRFLVTGTPDLRSIPRLPGLFTLVKARSMIERMIDIRQRNEISKVFEMGIFRGGSVVLHDQIFRPRKLVAIEYSRESVKVLDEYIHRRGKRETIRPYYGVNQADRFAMEKILASEFPERDIDLVVDDASHRYRETREAFNSCFPYLKAGGHYLVEDWAWAHLAGMPWQIRPWHFWKRPPFSGGRALSNLLIELFMTAASRPDLIQEIVFNHNMILVKKGKAALPPGRFDIKDHYLLRGKRFRAWL